MDMRWVPTPTAPEPRAWRGPAVVSQSSLASRATVPEAPCASCPVARLCLPAGLDDASRQALDALRIGRHRLRKGQKLYRERERFLFVHAVRFGSFKTAFQLADGGEHVTGFHFAGDVIGFDGTADGLHSTTATALESAEACAIPYALLEEACAQHPALRRRVAQLTGLQLVREYRAAKLVAGRQTEERVAGFLLQMSESMRERGYSRHAFQLRMSRSDIGSYLDTTLETVSRCLSQFARHGFIAVHNRHIELLDAERLRACYANAAEG